MKYEPGELKAVAYKDGKPWAEAVTRTTGPAAKVTLQPDRNQLTPMARTCRLSPYPLSTKTA